jgi:predicted nuclease with TOPRIM domain
MFWFISGLAVAIGLLALLAWGFHKDNDTLRQRIEDLGHCLHQDRARNYELRVENQRLEQKLRGAKAELGQERERADNNKAAIVVLQGRIADLQETLNEQPTERFHIGPVSVYW